MKNYLQRNYWETKAKYEKFRRRLNRRIKNGAFYRLSVKKQRQLVERVKKLFEKLKELQLALKLGTAGATMALALSFGNVSGQGAPEVGKHKIFKNGKHHHGAIMRNNKQFNSDLFVQVRGANNPFGGSNPFDGLITYSGWADFADLDSDGDLDVMVGVRYWNEETGERYGAIKFYKNVGTTELAVLEDQTDNNNPFIDFEFDNDPSIRFVDIDNDGDLDLFATDRNYVEYYSYYTIRYFKNTGSATVPAFEEQLDTNNPFDGIEFDYPYGFSFIDIDGDNDLDLFIGESGHVDYYSKYSIRYFKNTGTVTEPSFEGQTENNNPLGIVTNSDYHSYIPSFADLDGDGDFDAIIGNNDGFAQYYKNVGTATDPDFEEQVGSGNPFDDVLVGWKFNAKFIDIDNDNDIDAFIHDGDGMMKFFENTGSETSPEMTDQNGIDPGYWAFLDFADLDGDGDLDLITGTMSYDYDSETYNSIVYYKNVGTASLPIYEEQSGANDPFENLNLGYVAFPTFVDLDNDGDFDFFNLMYDDYYESTLLQYFKNIGTPTEPQFVEQTGIDNPLNEVDSEYFPFLSFADIDNDGDFDCFIGTSIDEGEYYYYGVIKYYKNTGTSETPVFEEATSPISGQFDDIYLMKPDFADIDMDGDLDCIISVASDYAAKIYFFKNTGTVTDPIFTQQTGVDNPFENLMLPDFFVYPALADIDSDGDTDCLIGTYSGAILFYKNILINTRVAENDRVENLKLYPNPSNGIVKIDLANNSILEVNIELYDYLGKKVDVFNFESNKIELDITHLPSGMYFVKIRQGESIVTSKIIKE